MDVKESFVNPWEKVHGSNKWGKKRSKKLLDVEILKKIGTKTVSV